MTTEAVRPGPTPGGVYKAVSKAMSQIEAIGKDRRNTTQNFQFRGIDDIYNALHGVLHANGLFTVPRVIGKTLEERQSKNGGTIMRVIVEMEYAVMHEDGSSFVVGPMLGEAMDSGDKACSKAMAVAHKYAFVQLFAIPTEDTEADDVTQPATTRQPIPLARGEPRKTETARAPEPRQPAAPLVTKGPTRLPVGPPDPAMLRTDADRHPTKPAGDATTADVVARRKAISDKLMEWADGQKPVAQSILQQIMPGVTLTSQLVAELDLRRVEFALLFIPHVPGRTVEAANAYLAGQWSEPALNQMSMASIEACSQRVLEMTGSVTREYAGEPNF